MRRCCERRRRGNCRSETPRIPLWEEGPPRAETPPVACRFTLRLNDRTNASSIAPEGDARGPKMKGITPSGYALHSRFHSPPRPPKLGGTPRFVAFSRSSTARAPSAHVGEQCGLARFPSVRLPRQSAGGGLPHRKGM